MSVLTSYDNSKISCDVALVPLLHKIADVDISSLKNDSRFLLFTNEDEIEDKHIFSLDKDPNSEEYSIVTGNIVGFVGINDVQVGIHSRFANGEKDYFLHYMLSKVFNINMLNLEHGQEKEDLFDFLVFLFPFFLGRAMKKGIVHSYVKYVCDDSNVKGSINVPRFLKGDVPFLGKISYDKREYSADNNLTELVRHTIEYIGAGSYSSIIRNGAVAADVRKIVEITPRYDRAKRESVINRNLRPIRHPYYSEWTDLQKICLMVLRHRKLNYAESKDRIYGIVFDVAWLWEEYLNKVFIEKGLPVIHPENKKKRGAINLFKEGFPRYPDYYWADRTIVMDAKYKRFNDKNDEDLRNDLHQMITYMFLLGSERGVFLFPDEIGTKLKKIGTFNNDQFTSKKVEELSLHIPQKATCHKEFGDAMRIQEDLFIEALEPLTVRCQSMT